MHFFLVIYFYPIISYNNMINKKTNYEETMKTFEYKWKYKSVWQQEEYKTDTIQAEDISKAREILHEKFYGFVKDPNCMFGGGHNKDTQEYLYNSLKQI